jgi:hypothetical protein
MKKPVRSIAEELKPPTSPDKLLAKFARWCRQEGIDVLKEDLKGKNFYRFQRQIKERYEEAKKREDLLLPLVKPPDPHAIDACDATANNFGWNSCLLEIMKTGEPPGEAPVSRSGCPPPNWNSTFKNGWDEAKEEVLRNIPQVFKTFSRIETLKRNLKKGSPASKSLRKRGDKIVGALTDNFRAKAKKQ